MNDICALIHLSRLQVENANAVSGPLSWGFPPPTAFTGFTHALERRLGDVPLGGIGIVCHGFEPQVAFPAGNWRPGRFRLARHPYIAGWKKFKNEAAAIVEEGRAHLEVSLLIAVLAELDGGEREALADRIRRCLPTLRLAGGAIRIPDCRVRVEEWPEFADEQREAFHRLRYRLLPGFTLVQRDDLLARRLESLRRERPEAGSLDAFLDLLALHVVPKEDEATGATDWQVRPRPGWLVPLPIGYAALSPLHAPGEVSGTRDRHTPFRFVESLYTIGQWLSPHRLTTLEAMLWHPAADAGDGLYLCRNEYVQHASEEDFDDEED